MCRISVPGTLPRTDGKTSTNISRDKKTVPEADPPSIKDVQLLYEFLDRSTKLTVLTGAGISTECGIPDYRSPNGAYSSGFKPITHQEFLRSSRARRRYWARSYAGWRRFTAAQPSAAHTALATIDRAGRIDLMITQNWAEAIDNLDHGNPGSDKSFGMKQRPDGDIEIDERFWEEDFIIPTCHKCNGVLKPDVVFFGDNVPKDRADMAMEASRRCDAFLVLGSSLMTMSAFRLVRAAHEAGAATAIVNIGVTRADNFVPLKINARLGEVWPWLILTSYNEYCMFTASNLTSFALLQILPRLLDMGSISIPAV
ncbi:hypothetical protein JHK85_015770 [Glycine max]|nr:hypothetical protein JHK85_015770 [Glycine max]